MFEQNQASVVILAGGKSTRMGRDKASLPWEDQDILHSLIACMQKVCQDIIVVSNEPRTLTLPVRVVPDLIPGRGPLSGIHSGLFHARYPVAFVISCDMPFAVPHAVQIILDYAKDDQWDIVMPSYKERRQPLFACYRKSSIAVIKQLLYAGDYRVLSLCGLLRCLYLPEGIWPPAVKPALLFRNLNTYKDYQQALMLIRKPD